MFTFPPPDQTRTTPTHSSLGYDFALLGLKFREARVDVIRHAAEKTAAKIPDEAQGGQRVEMLAELATATYRLLDPRRRAKPLERIQLSIASEVEPVLATVAKRPLVKGPIKLKVAPSVTAKLAVKAELIEQTADLVQPSTVNGFHKVSYRCDSTTVRILDRKSRLGMIAFSVLSTLIASTAWISWLLFS